MTDKLAGRELDDKLHAVIGKKAKHAWRQPDRSYYECDYCGAFWWKNNGEEEPPTTDVDVPNYSTDDNAIRTVRAEVARRGLIWEFTKALSELVSPKWNIENYTFHMVDAPTELQARAALVVLTEASAKLAEGKVSG